MAVNLLSGLCANGTGGVTLFMKNFGDSILANPSINLGALHRIAAISGAGFDSLPHNGAIAFQLSVFKLSYKEGYFPAVHDVRGGEPAGRYHRSGHGNAALLSAACLI